MSASDKKKLRKEQNAALLTEKQKNERKEARKLKAYTWTFAIVMVLVVAIVVGVVVTPLIDGAIRRNSHAITIGDHEITSGELTYFYMDAINEHQQEVYSQYYESFGDYWTMMLGFDTTKPLDEQNYDTDSGKTWADYFLDKAIESARNVYALTEDAAAKKYTLTEEEQANVDSTISTMELYAQYYGYSSVKSYLRASYGNTATVDSYTEYYQKCALASSYLNKHADDLEYDVKDYDAYAKDKYEEYSTVSFVHYTMRNTSYLGEGKKDENGTTTWTEDEKEAAREALKADLEILLGAKIKDKESFDKAIQALEINKDVEDSKKPTSTEVKNTFYGDVALNATALEWLKSGECKPGEVKAFDVYTYPEVEDKDHEHGDDCGCDRTTDGYTIVLFLERNDNEMKMVNVRHILVSFKGGTTDSSGNTTYSDLEKDKAKTEAEAILKEWKDGKANEASFGELANKKSDDQGGKVTNGGLYEDIYPGQMVEAFEDWCFDKDRKPGDTGIVETEYGYHVMFFSSTDEMSYRNFLIDADLRNEDTENWCDDLVGKLPYKLITTKHIETDFVAQN